MKKKTLFLSLPLLVGLGGGLYASSASALSGTPADSISCEGTECVLNSDATGMLFIDPNETIFLDMNGHSITNDSVAIVLYEGGNLTLKGAGEVSSTGSSAIYLYGEGSNVTLNDNVAVRSDAAEGVDVGQTNSVSASFTMNGGSIHAQEFGVLALMDSVVNINGGTITTVDNCAVGGNGQGTNVKENGITINITGGTLNSNIVSSGYSSCGVYMPNIGQVNISGGTINSSKGAGVVMRAGDLNITGGTINADGPADFMGKVGDSRIVVPVSAVVVDYDASYPGYQAGGVSGRISGSAVLNGVDGTIRTVNTAEKDENIEVTGGRFNIVPYYKYMVDGYDAFFDNDDDMFTVFATPKTVSEATDVELAELETYNITGLPMEYEKYFWYEIEGDLNLTVDSSKITASDKTGTGGVKITMEGIKQDYTLADYNVTVSEPNYEALEGDGAEYYLDEGGELAFRFSGPIDLVDKVYLDGELVDPSNYTLTEGSTIVTFNAEYLAILSEGEHMVMVSYTNGGTATANFTIAESEDVPVPSTDAGTPETGAYTDSSSKESGASSSIVSTLALSILVGILTTAAGLVVVKRHFARK